MAERSPGTVRPHGTAIAHVRIKFHDGAEGKGLDLALGTGDRAVPEIERKGRLRELAAILWLPGFTHDLPAPAKDLIDERAVDVPAIDQQLVDVEALSCQVGRQGRHRLRFWTIRGRDGTRDDQAAIHVGRDVTLEPVEPLAGALPAMTHLPV